MCLVDDAQWLDVASSQVLGFVGRRLLAESVLLLFAVREAGDERLFPALPTLTLEGLTDDDARAFLTAAIPGHLDEQVRDRLVAETRGNPLALLELVRGMSDAELAGGFAVPPTAFRVRASPRPLPAAGARPPGADAAADAAGGRRPHGGRHAPLAAASAYWASDDQDAAPAASQQLLEIGARCGSGIPWCGRPRTRPGRSQDRCAAHRALAEATDPQADPERRVWHLAAAATGPDEEVAAELERTAGRAQARAGLAGAAAFLQRRWP